MNEKYMLIMLIVGYVGIISFITLILWLILRRGDVK